MCRCPAQTSSKPGVITARGCLRSWGMGSTLSFIARAGLAEPAQLPRLLVELGIGSREAISMVRSVPPGALETAAQESYVHSLSDAHEPVPPSTANATRDRARGALVGLAVGGRDWWNHARV